jgi:hypothetical protein
MPAEITKPAVFKNFFVFLCSNAPEMTFISQDMNSGIQYDKRTSTAVALLECRPFLFFIVSSLTSRLLICLCAQCNAHTRLYQTCERLVHTWKMAGLCLTVCSGCTYYHSVLHICYWNHYLQRFPGLSPLVLPLKPKSTVILQAKIVQILGTPSVVPLICRLKSRQRFRVPGGAQLHVTSTPLILVRVLQYILCNFSLNPNFIQKHISLFRWSSQ